MSKEWFAIIERKELGPFAPEELFLLPHVTPDTQVKKKDWDKWIPIRHVPELQDLFKDKLPAKQTHETPSKENVISEGEDLALTLPQPDPFFTYFWIVLGLFFIIYLFYLLYD